MTRSTEDDRPRWVLIEMGELAPERYATREAAEAARDALAAECDAAFCEENGEAAPGDGDGYPSVVEVDDDGEVRT